MPRWSVENYVNALIEEEMTRFSPANYLEHLPPPPLQLTPLLAQEFVPCPFLAPRLACSGGGGDLQLFWFFLSIVAIFRAFCV